MDKVTNQMEQMCASEGWKIVPVEPTPEIIAAAAIAAWPTASLADIALARKAAPIVLMQMDAAPGVTADSLAAMLATMAPAYRAMLAAAPAAPVAHEVGQVIPPESQVQADEAKLYRDLTGDAMALGYDGIPAALEALRQTTVAQKVEQSAQVKHGDVPSIEITLRQAESLVGFFGGHDCEVSIIERPAAWVGMADGLYAYCTEYPDEGAQYLGPTEVDDDLAMHGSPTAPGSTEASAQDAPDAVRDAARLEIIEMCNAAKGNASTLREENCIQAISDAVERLRTTSTQPTGEQGGAA